MSILQIIITLIFPPLAVLLRNGIGSALIINILLTLLAYFPGLIHAFYVQSQDDTRRKQLT